MITATNDTVLSKAVFILKQMSEDEKLQEAARIRERALHDEASYLQDAIDEGMAKGMAKGALEKTRHFVFKMLDRNTCDETIIDLADIDREQLNKFKAEYNKA